jgi:hypothetical protein
MINITELKKMLLSEVEEKKDLPGNQEKIAQAAEPKDKITAADFAALRAKKGMKEGDHEVSMAHNSLESIIKSAMELKAKLGNDERNIPGWIQDHMENMLDEKKKPSAGLTKKQKSAISKKAKAGKDIGKKGKGFEKIAKAAAEKYGSKERGQKVAAAAMWKSAAKKAK